MQPKEAEQSWPVQVFRKTEQGWHRMRVTSSSRGRSVTVKATPRRKYIALLRLQVRIRLSSSDDDAVSTTVIRRRHCLLVSCSNQKLRSLLLRFRDVSSCVEFADRLVALNPPSDAIQTDDNVANVVSRSHGTIADNQRVLSYVGSLLHDEDFVNLVDSLEASITASEDGARMLEALVMGGGGIFTEEANSKALPENGEAS